MKTIHQTFTDEEFKKLHSAKGQKSWHDFILKLAKIKSNSFLPKKEN
jgi:predicted CopG family antitoxin